MSTSEEFIFRSALPDADIPNVSLPEYIGSCIARHGDPDAAAYIDGPTGRSYTYKQLTELIKRLAAALAERGIVQRDVVMILAPNLPEVKQFYSRLGSSGWGQKLEWYTLCQTFIPQLRRGLGLQNFGSCLSVDFDIACVSTRAQRLAVLGAFTAIRGLLK